MAGKRLARLNEQLKREIVAILRGRVRDPRIGTPTVTGVDVTPDLWVAKVFVRTEGDEAQRARSLEGLEAAAPFVRKSLGEILTIRRIPELRFLEDRTLEQAMRIERILGEVVPPGGFPDDEPEVEGPEHAEAVEEEDATSRMERSERDEDGGAAQ